MAAAAIYSLFIINKSGGLIYYKVHISLHADTAKRPISCD